MRCFSGVPQLARDTQPQIHLPVSPQSIEKLILSIHLSLQAVVLCVHSSRQSPLGIMKIFFRYQTFRFIWLTKPPGRHFHKDRQLWTPLTLADFEAINLCNRPLPENFNFAADVLDQWAQKEKVYDDGLPVDAWCPLISQSSISLFCGLPLNSNALFHPLGFHCLFSNCPPLSPGKILDPQLQMAGWPWSLLCPPSPGWFLTELGLFSFSSPSPTQQCFVFKLVTGLSKK